MRQIIIDTESTDFPLQGRIIELACIELYNGHITGRTIHEYIDPGEDATMHPDAQALHGYSIDDVQRLSGGLRFTDLADKLLTFIEGAELIAQYAPHDIKLLNAELARLGDGWGPVQDICTITCTKAMSKKHLPQLPRHKLDDLCDHYGVDRKHRHLHDANTDAMLLTHIYLAMREEGAQRVPVDLNQRYEA